MSCPKDLHSLFIDGEMPENFVGEYEAQRDADPKSRAEFGRMKEIHDLLNSDAAAESQKISDEFMEESFRRLEGKMRFARTVEFARPRRSAASLARFPLSLAAAAAVFALVFVPLSRRGAGEEPAIHAIARTEIEPIAEADVKIDGNISSEKLPEVFAAVKENVSVAKAESAVDLSSKINVPEQKTVRASSMVSTRARNFRSSMTSIDVFRPDFTESAIQVRVPEFGEIQMED